MDLFLGSQIIFQHSPHPTAWALAFFSAALLLIKHCAHDLNFLSVFTEVIVIVHSWESRTRGQWKHRGGWPTEIKQGPGLSLNIQYVTNQPKHWTGTCPLKGLECVEGHLMFCHHLLPSCLCYRFLSVWFFIWSIFIVTFCIDLQYKRD